MKKVFLMSIYVLFADVIYAQVSDLYYNAFVAYLESEKVTKDTIHLISKGFLDSTRHMGSHGAYFNYILEAADNFGEVTKEDSMPN